MNNFVDFLKMNSVNARGTRVNRKIVVFESDDWGAQRMPSKSVFDTLLKAGIRVDQSLYDKLDSLENRNDLTNLFSLLSSHSNSNNHPPIFTFNTVMGNPNYEKILLSDFHQFHHQPFFDSYNYYYNENNQDLWSSAMNSGLMRPQFHGREHLNIQLWLKDLRFDNKNTKLSFNHEFYGLKTSTSSRFQKNYLAAYRVESFDELDELKKILSDGLDMFYKNFGFKSSSFIAPNYTWPEQLNEFLSQKDVRIIQSQRKQLVPSLHDGKLSFASHYFGKKNQHNQIYLLRNVLFEPYLDQDKDWVDLAMKQIENAFFWKKPAIISTHRINYASNMSITNRDKSLFKLNELISQIYKKWRDVDFKSSDSLF